MAGRRPARSRRLCRIMLVVMGLWVTAAGCAESAEPGFIIATGTNQHDFQVELADTPETRAKGLMFRTELAEDQSMLFDFNPPRDVTMWMKNTLLPLDMMFVSAKGEIVYIARNTTPNSEQPISAGQPVRAVIEVLGGLTTKLNINIGDKVIHPIFGNR